MVQSALDILQAARSNLVMPPVTHTPSGGGGAGVVGRFERFVPIIKGLDQNDERFVLGIVLEPGVVDLQNDRTSAAEIRKAAHGFMEAAGKQGFMHRVDVSKKVRILETYLAPADFKVGGVMIKKGTWLMAWRVLDDKLWALVKAGKITGFSIGGTGRRSPG